jgi:outer membrane lipopolysaccharide assembly protein LptE/RlpB
MQQKISAAESEAEQMLLPGVHSTEPGEAGEKLPVRVELFRKYFEKKKSAVSKTAQQEQFRTTLRTMRNTLVPPANSLDHRDGNSELVMETTAPVNNHATANSLVVPTRS